MKLKDVVQDFDKAVNTEEVEVEIEETEKSDKVEAETEDVVTEEDEVEEEVVEKSDEVEVEKSDDKEEEDKEETEEEKKKRKKKEEKEKKKSEEEKEDKEEDEAEKAIEEPEAEEVFKSEDMVGFLQSVLKSYENTREELVSVKEELETIKGLFVKGDIVDEVNKSDEGVAVIADKITLDGETAIEKSEKSEEKVVEKAETSAPETEEVDGVSKSEDGETTKEGFATKNATNVDNLEEAVKSEEVSKSDDESDEITVEEIENNFMEKFQSDIRADKVSKNEQYELRRAYIDMRNGKVEGNVDRLIEYLSE